MMNIEDVKLGDFIKLTSKENHEWLIYVKNIICSNDGLFYVSCFITPSARFKTRFPIYDTDKISPLSNNEKSILIRKIKNYRMNIYICNFFYYEY